MALGSTILPSHLKRSLVKVEVAGEVGPMAPKFLVSLLLSKRQFCSYGWESTLEGCKSCGSSETMIFFYGQTQRPKTCFML